MKTIGLLGGMSWESTIPYYRVINEAVKLRLGGLHSARIILHSVDFHDIERLQHEGKWDEAGTLLAEAAASLERAGAELLVICTNTMHKVAPMIERVLSIPLLHIADATGAEILKSKFSTVGLLGTRFTMEEDFYVDRLRSRHGLNVLIPNEPERVEIHRVIYDELCLGQILDKSRKTFHQVIERLQTRGAQGVILGCTEISMLVDPRHAAIPVFDTTRIHAEHAAFFALGA